MKKYVGLIVKGSAWLFLAGCVGLVLLICFYIWMIYGIHPSDEGTSGLSCEYDKNLQVMKAEMYKIQDGKRVITTVDPLLCEDSTFIFSK